MPTKQPGSRLCVLNHYVMFEEIIAENCSKILNDKNLDPGNSTNSKHDGKESHWTHDGENIPHQRKK